MTTISLNGLDQHELLKLAESAGQQGDRAGALACLKEAASRADAVAVTHYLLGIEYAELRLYDRAIDQLEAALALDPALAIARLQLGLLWLSSGNAERALTALGPLDTLDEMNAIRHFGDGLCELARDVPGAALVALRRGMTLNPDNAPLNADMQLLIDRIEALPTTTEGGVHEPDARLMFLSAYRSNTSH